jgi:hypothetical protein
MGAFEFVVQVYDPGLQTGFAEFTNSGKFVSGDVIALPDLINHLFKETGPWSIIVVEQFANPFSKLTKEALQTIENVGAIKAFANKFGHECHIQMQCQKEGYMESAKILADSYRKEYKEKTKHMIDAIAHGLRYFDKVRR